VEHKSVRRHCFRDAGQLIGDHFKRETAAGWELLTDVCCKPPAETTVIARLIDHQEVTSIGFKISSCPPELHPIYVTNARASIPRMMVSIPACSLCARFFMTMVVIFRRGPAPALGRRRIAHQI
jgi:hypothetical protein